MKPGWQTSEFWLSLIAMIISGTLATGLISNVSVLSVLGGIASVLAAMGYAGFRTAAKVGTANAQAKIFSYEANEDTSIRTTIQHD